MDDGDRRWLANMPAKYHAPLRRYAAGDLPPAVALMHLFMHAGSDDEASDVLRRLADEREALPERSHLRRRFSELLEVAAANPQAFETVRAVLDVLPHDRTDGTDRESIAAWRAAYDRAARISPDAGVALYALGNPELFAAATAEIVAHMERCSLIAPDRVLLEIGCGSGRFLEALAGRVRLVVGTDISARMVLAARQRCHGLSNLAILRSSGLDLAMVGDMALDAVFAVDSFPYLVMAGRRVLEQHIRDAARVLRRHGTLLIYNFSYRGDADQDCLDIEGLAGLAGFDIAENGSRNFSFWDGRTFRLTKRA